MRIKSIPQNFETTTVHYDVENAPLGRPFKDFDDFYLAYRNGVRVPDAIRDVANGIYFRTFTA